MNKSEKKLFDITLSNLMNLPAYRLNDKYRNIFREYIYGEFKKSIRKKDIEEYPEENHYQENTIEFISDIYQKPNQWKILWFSFNSLPNKDKRTGWIAIIFLAFAVLVRVSNPLLILFGFFCLLVFVFSFLIYGIQFSMWYSYVNSTFSIINTILDDIKDYIVNFGNLNKGNLYLRGHIILKNIIEDEISGLDYDWKKINLFNILFAFFMTFLFVYILGDSSVKIVKWIANIFNFGNFELIQDLNLEKLAFFILFPIGIAISKDLVISGLKQRNKRLRSSLVIVENRLQYINSSSIQHQEVISSRHETSLEYEQDLVAAINKYQKGEISMEKAAQIANLNRRDFLEVLARKKIDVFTVDFDDLDRELERG